MDEQTKDIIWDTIIDSAKTRFEYKSYADDMRKFGENVPENILRLIIVGYAADFSNEEIKSEINMKLLMAGLSFEDDSLDELLLDKQEVFKKEILAANTALALLDQGRQIPGVLVQIKRILLSK